VASYYAVGLWVLEHGSKGAPRLEGALSQHLTGSPRALHNLIQHGILDRECRECRDMGCLTKVDGVVVEVPTSELNGTIQGMVLGALLQVMLLPSPCINPVVTCETV
jgi:hypothetical protein